MNGWLLQKCALFLFLMVLASMWYSLNSKLNRLEAELKESELKYKATELKSKTAELKEPELQHKALSHCPVGSRTGMLVQPDATFLRTDEDESETQDKFFQRLLNSVEFKRYSPTALSRNPWILQFDTFLSIEECKALLDDCGSFTVDTLARGAGRRGNYRNSSSYNCGYENSCAQKSGIMQYRQRLAALGLGEEHAEGVSILKYQEGGFYKKHHDFIVNPNMNCGPRVLTVMAYLSNVEAGGATSFFSFGHRCATQGGQVANLAGYVARQAIGEGRTNSSRGSGSFGGDKICCHIVVRTI
eukprot:gnl/TRDRNA2_/TRDRNA2_160950_c0_seq1.p1 gnl/TRDRNA2_/TRDRNA2_160950_c0~~gnl/TRDRNA2_/TRDRNA2_160950_c0_seq1.p1  ORF type:complete len:301 (+),score=31.22 gnl/TRDRNA2_/TRDRNA2_160950_c0_seq1:116-1018(+)